MVAWLDSIYMVMRLRRLLKNLSHFLRVLALGTGPYLYELLVHGCLAPVHGGFWRNSAHALRESQLELWTLFVQDPRF